MRRSCVVCRKRFAPADLYRFQLNSQFQLSLVHTRTKGRSAWLCKSQNCIQKLETHPQMAQRALRQYPQKGPDLNAQIKRAMASLIQNELLIAYRSGWLRKYTLDQAISQRAICLITTVQMPTSALTDVTIPCFILPANLLPKITPPDRAVLILDNKCAAKSDLLLRYLQEHVLMG